MKRKNVVVLMGGWSLEREVSLVSGQGVLNALLELGYNAVGIDVKKDLVDLIDKIKAAKPDVIFNALHGTGGEDGVIQGALEMLQIPYTHSGVAASAIAMNKVISKAIFKSCGIPVAEDKIITPEEFRLGHPMELPYVVKPIADGSSRGTSVIKNDDDYKKSAEEWAFGEQILVEKYIPGREINVAILDGKAKGAIEIEVKDGYYDYQAKYEDNRANHIMPAPLPEGELKKVSNFAEAAYRAIGCRGGCRADFRYDDTNGDAKFYMLEINTQPGMTPTSLLPEIVGYYGMSYNQLVEHLTETATLEESYV